MAGDIRWARVDEQVRAAIVSLIDSGMTVAAIKRFREASGFGLADSKAAIEDIMYAMNSSPCPHCGKALRTKLAQQCFHCGADWHAPLSAF
jgi:hypothetical protein